MEQLNSKEIVDQAITDFDEIKSQIENNGVPVGSNPTRNYAELIADIPTMVAPRSYEYGVATETIYENNLVTMDENSINARLEQHKYIDPRVYQSTYPSGFQDDLENWSNTNGYIEFDADKYTIDAPYVTYLTYRSYTPYKNSNGTIGISSFERYGTYQYFKPGIKEATSSSGTAVTGYYGISELYTRAAYYYDSTDKKIKFSNMAGKKLNITNLNPEVTGNIVMPITFSRRFYDGTNDCVLMLYTRCELTDDLPTLSNPTQIKKLTGPVKDLNMNTIYASIIKINSNEEQTLSDIVIPDIPALHDLDKVDLYRNMLHIFINVNTEDYNSSYYYYFLMRIFKANNPDSTTKNFDVEQSFSWLRYNKQDNTIVIKELDNYKSTNIILNNVNPNSSQDSYSSFSSYKLGLGGGYCMTGFLERINLKDTSEETNAYWTAWKKHYHMRFKGSTIVYANPFSSSYAYWGFYIVFKTDFNNPGLKFFQVVEDKPTNQIEYADFSFLTMANNFFINGHDYNYNAKANVICCHTQRTWMAPHDIRADFRTYKQTLSFKQIALSYVQLASTVDRITDTNINPDNLNIYRARVKYMFHYEDNVYNQNNLKYKSTDTYPSGNPINMAANELFGEIFTKDLSDPDGYNASKGGGLNCMLAYFDKSDVKLYLKENTLYLRSFVNLIAPSTAPEGSGLSNVLGHEGMIEVAVNIDSGEFLYKPYGYRYGITRLYNFNGDPYISNASNYTTCIKDNDKYLLGWNAAQRYESDLKNADYHYLNLTQTKYPISLVRDLQEAEHIGIATNNALVGDDVNIRLWTEFETDPSIKPGINIPLVLAPSNKKIFELSKKEFVVNQFQKNIVVNSEAVYGSLEYISSFPEFSEGASGNFLVLMFPDATIGETITVELKGGNVEHSGPIQIGTDGLFVGHIANNDVTIEVTQPRRNPLSLSLKELELKTL